MPEIEIVNENPLTMVEMGKKLEEINKRDKELNFRATKVKEYIDQFITLENKKLEEIKKKIQELNIPRLKDRHISKILDIMPKDMDSLKVIFIGDNITIKQEDLDKILEVIKKE
tara:strand:+ start:18376 stop:18717 length:342 start_codon:yes stop_codon:yes gene_type:complete